MSIIRKSGLPNGLKVITEALPDVESSSIGVWVRTGSRDETPDCAGVSHFIEHLLFKGTKRRTALDISREIESVGGVLNAFTGREYTCFYAKVLADDLPLAIDLLSDMVTNSTFDPVEIGKEKQVVLHEIKMVEDTPDDLIHDLYAERFWQDHPLGRPILGTRGTIRSMPRRKILDYFRSRYGAGNIFIAAAGKLDHDRVVGLVKKAFAGVGKSARLPRTATPVPRRGGRFHPRKKLEQAHLCLGVPVPPQAHPDRFKVYLLSTILGGGMSSRLFQEIREKRALAYSVYSYLNLCRDSGSLIVYAGTSPESFSEVVDIIVKEFAKLRRGVSAEELDRAKEQLKGGMFLGLETTDSRMTKLARDEIYFGRTLPIKRIVREIDRVTPDDMKAIASRLLTSRRATLVALGRVRKRGLPRVFVSAP